MADKIIAEYIVKTDQAIKNLDKLEKEVKDLSKQGKKAAKDIEGNFKKTSSSLVSQFSKVGVALGVAFGAQQLVEFGKEAVNLAAQMEGVERAFKRIGGVNSNNLLRGLRTATRGTVSDLVLMQKAVQASNFKIPLENLASLFKFAQARARETGESVEYLTNSIVLGIGRKSPLILDNLGISAVELRTRLKGVGVEAANVGDIAQIIGDIADEELAKMGDQADTTADKIAQLSTALENFKTDFGAELIDIFSELNNEVSKTSELLGFEGVDAGSIILEGVSNVIKDMLSPITTLNWILQKNIEAFNALKGELSPEDLEKQEKAVNDLANAFAGMRKAIDEGKESIEEIDEVQIEVIKNLKFYNDLIAELQTKQKDANTTRAEVRQLEDDINEAIRQRLILLGRLREVGGDSMEEIQSIASMELLAQTELTDDIIGDHERRNEEIERLQDELNASLAEKAQEQRERDFEAFQQYAGAIGGVLHSLSELSSSLAQEELKNLDDQLEQGIISREEYEVKRKQILNEQAEQEKTLAIFDSAINGAAAIVSAFNEGGPILAAIVGAGVATQIAAIAATPVPQFAEGGFVDSKGKIHGRSHAAGGVHIEAEGDEFIVKGSMAKKNAGLLEALNNGSGDEWINKNMVYPAIQNVLDNSLESNSGRWGDMNAILKDHNIIASQDRMRQSMTHGFKYLAKELKSNNRRKRGGYDSI